MATINNFEELKSWQKARELAGVIYELTRRERFSRDYGLRDQIQRAASSVMHNIAEGFESGSDPEFVRFLKMAAARQQKGNHSFILLWMSVTSPKKSGKKHTYWRRRQSN